MVAAGSAAAAQGSFGVGQRALFPATAEHRALPQPHLLVEQAQSELFKWAPNDDLYARDLVERYIAAFDQYPDIVLVRSWTAMVDESDAVTKGIQIPA